MKKNIIICFITGWVFLLTGCDSWLDVKPYDSMTEEQLFSTELGIQKALNGLYLGLASENLYAKEMTCGTVDVLAQRFLIKTSEHPYYDMVNYKYSNSGPKGKFDNIWKQAYHLIADCNEFLKMTSENRSVLTRNDYPVMMGEALALRTFIHFDLFRLFGPAYNEANKTKEAIPYYNYVTDVPAPIMTTGSLMKVLIADIDTAIVWLAKDPVRTNGIGTGDGFGDYRNLRMNYYAAWALKARMLWYMGEEYKTEAHQIVVALINGKDPVSEAKNNFIEVFPFVKGQQAATDRVYFSEILFGLHNMKRDDIYKKIFSVDLEDKSIFWVTQSYYAKLYTQENDYRNKWFEDASADRGEVKAFIKFKPGDAYDKNPYGHETQALIRYSELFLIAASTSEYDADKKDYLEKLRISRGYQTGNAIGQDLEQLLDEEYQREFYGEGQYFFFLKRNQIANIKNQEGNNVNMTSNYVIPLPDSEKNNRYE